LDNALVTIQNLSVVYTLKAGLSGLFKKRKGRTVKAVNDLSLSLEKGEILSLVGESGSGKTTTGRALLRLIKEEVKGTIRFEGKDVFSLSKQELKGFRKKAQMIFQDPYQALNPRNTVSRIVGESLEIHHPDFSWEKKQAMIAEALEWCGLKPVERYWNRYPHELSGGQRQRVAIAGALILKPQLVVADEPVSMLDASVRLDILSLLNGLKEEIGVTCLFITHDLALAWLISNRIAVMFAGTLVELGSAGLIAEGALHPYSKALIAAQPSATSSKERRRASQIERKEDPAGVSHCCYYRRCSLATECCGKGLPQLEEVNPGHFVRCFNWRTPV